MNLDVHGSHGVPPLEGEGTKPGMIMGGLMVPVAGFRAFLPQELEGFGKLRDRLLPGVGGGFDILDPRDGGR